MGGVLIPSPGTVAAGELFVLFHFWRLGWGGGIEGIRGDRGTFGQQVVPVGDTLALESNFKHDLVAEILSNLGKLFNFSES